MEHILAQTDPKDNPLVAPVHMPDDAHAILKPDHPATSILAQSGIVVQRQVEMLNLFIGFEQANRYVILDPHGNHIGYMAEHDGGIGKAMARQWFRTHRAFTTHVFDRHSQEVLRFHRPFAWINTRILVYDPLSPSSGLSTSWSPPPAEPSPDTQLPPQRLSQLPMTDMRVVGEAHSEWAPLRRKYNLFLSHEPRLVEHAAAGPRGTNGAGPRSGDALNFAQFASINEPMLSWNFALMDRDRHLIGSVSRAFRGWGREIFTDTGSYALRMDAAAAEDQPSPPPDAPPAPRAAAELLGAHPSAQGMTLDQRAVMLATAVTVDYDYFSRHSSQSNAGFLPLWVGGGGEAAGAGAGAAGAGEAAGGIVVGGAGRAVGSAAGGIGAGEGAIAGAGTMAGYEAMQRGMGRGSDATASDPGAGAPRSGLDQSAGPSADPQSPQAGWGEQDQGGDLWGSDGADPWSGGGGTGDSGGGEGGGFFQWLWDFFFGD